MLLKATQGLTTTDNSDFWGKLNKPFTWDFFSAGSNSEVSLRFLVRNYLLQFSVNEIFVTITNKLIGLRYFIFGSGKLYFRVNQFPITENKYCSRKNLFFCPMISTGILYQPSRAQYCIEVNFILYFRYFYLFFNIRKEILLERRNNVDDSEAFMNNIWYHIVIIITNKTCFQLLIDVFFLLVFIVLLKTSSW